MVDLTEGKLDEALEYAKKIGDESLQSCLDRLKKTEETYELDGRPIQTNVSTDFAPLSFYFERHDKSTGMFKGNGGIIVHGSHDGFGSGSAPTFSVSLEPCSGWSIHT